MIINKERASIKRIKRANTDWWINEKAVVDRNGMIYIAYTNGNEIIARKSNKSKITCG